MSKKDEQKAKLSGNGHSKSRMKVFVAGFDLEGGDDVLAEGFKAISQLTTAISQGTVVPPVRTTKPALAAAPAPKPGSATTTAEEDLPEEPAAVETEVVEEAE